jgi:hypothetical protein
VIASLGFWRASPAWTLWVPKPNSLSEFEDDVMESFKEKPKEKTEGKQGIWGQLQADPQRAIRDNGTVRKNRDSVGSEWLFSSEAAIGRKSL